MVSATQWCAPVLEPKAVDLITRADWQTPLAPEPASIVTGALASLNAGLQPTPAREISRMVTKLANIYRAERDLTEPEAAARLTSYCQLLADVPPDLLSKAFRTAGQRCKFFPTVAELRAFVSVELAARRLQRDRAAWLVRRAKDWRPEPAPLTKEELAEIARVRAEVTKTLDQTDGRRSAGEA